MVASVSNTTSTGVSSPSDSLVITSPILSASSLSSSGFDFVAVGQKSSNSEQFDSTAAISTTTSVCRQNITQFGEDSSFSDDDEIVWGLSEGEELEGTTSGLGDVLSDDDFVVLSRTRSPVSSSRDRTKASESAGSQIGTIRGAPPHAKLFEARPSVNYLQDNDASVEAPKGKYDKDTVASELAKELTKLNINTGSPVGEASGTRTPVEGEPQRPEPSISGALPKTSPKKKGKKAKKDRTPEEEELRKQRKKERKEKKEREKVAAKALAKGKEKEVVAKAASMKKKSKPKQPNGSTVATPVATPIPVTPYLSENVSIATLVPLSSIATSHITLESAALPEEARSVPVLAPLPSPPLEPAKTSASVNESPKKKNKKVKKVKASELTTLIQHDSVTAEKVSEQTYDSKSAPAPYDEAASYITSYITNTSAHHDPICHLTLLQSLIIELGLIKDISLLPRSIKAAKKFIKPRVFLNIKDYITKRHEGPKAVQDLMFPTRSALVKDMKKKKNFVSLQWIKKCGLQDLLVGVFHR